MKKLTLSASVIAAIAGTAICYNAIAANISSFNKKQTQDIEKIVHQYLVTNPEVLVEASEAYRIKMAEQASSKAKAAITKHVKELLNSQFPTGYGNNEGNVFVVEFIDYQCGHCKTMSPIIEDLINTTPNLKFIVKELPLFGNNSIVAARAAVAASQQSNDAFRKFHTALLKETKPLTEKEIMNIAKTSGLDMKKLEQDMKSDAVKNHVTSDNFKLATEIGLQGTPAFIVTNKDGSKSVFIAGATSKEELQQAIKTVTG